MLAFNIQGRYRTILPAQKQAQLKLGLNHALL